MCAFQTCDRWECSRRGAELFHQTCFNHHRLARSLTWINRDVACGTRSRHSLVASSRCIGMTTLVIARNEVTKPSIPSCRHDSSFAMTVASRSADSWSREPALRRDRLGLGKPAVRGGCGRVPARACRLTPDGSVEVGRPIGQGSWKEDFAVSSIFPSRTLDNAKRAGIGHGRCAL